jgi:hypothetical protein
VRTTWASIPAVQIKDHLLVSLDEKVGDWIEDNYNFYLCAGAEFWLKTTLALSVGAASAVCALEGVHTPCIDPEPESDPSPGCDEEAPVESLADSLADMAWMAAVAAQWFGDEDDK